MSKSTDVIHVTRIGRRLAYLILAYQIRERAREYRQETMGNPDARADECEEIARLIESGELLRGDPSVREMMMELPR